MSDFNSSIQQFKAEFETSLSKLDIAVPKGGSLLQEAAQYSLMAGGKRLRPFLVYAAGKALGIEDQRWSIPAFAIELIHTYSLVHDDLPAMDDDDLRRGQATCHIKYDEATAILVGDGLQTLAFEVLAAYSQPELSSQVRLKMIQVLSQASGFNGMVGGQHLDLQGENKSLSLEQLKDLHRHKTGRLITAAIELGCLCCDQATAKQKAALFEYGEALGLAFQIVDDVLDIEGDTSELGKPQGSDQHLQKSTYPELMGLEGAKAAAQQQVDLALTALKGFGPAANMLRATAQYVLTRKH